jgi:hypothetical protein
MKPPRAVQACLLIAALTVAVYVTWFLRLALAVWESLAEGWRNRG